MISDLISRSTGVLVQGITGRQGQFHTKRMLDYGTNIVAGTSPGKGGQNIHGVPVFDSISDVAKKHKIDATVIFVPAPFAKPAVLEAIKAEVPLIIVITEGIPVHDMIAIRSELAKSRSIMIGPNCPGILVPGQSLLGIIPANFGTLGDTAVISRSGTLTYEAISSLTSRGIGQRVVIGIGGDQIPGSGFVDWLRVLESDSTVKNIVMIGEIGGLGEINAADFIKSEMSKKVFAYIAGHDAPKGVQLGHAGAILGDNDLEAASTKTSYLKDAGALTANSLKELTKIISYT